MENKYYKSKTKLLLDFHLPEWHKDIFSKFNTRDLIEKYQKYPIDLMLIYAKDHYGHSYYNTKVGHKHKNLGERDLLREFTDLAVEKGLPVGIYYTINFQVNVADESFYARGPEGNYILHEIGGVRRWPYICYNSKGYLDHCLAQLDELVGNYPMDAIWLDMLNYPFYEIGCYCNSCRKAFKEQYGHDNLPKKPSWDKVWRDFLDFRYRSNYRFAKALRDAIKKKKPNVAVIFNYHGAPNYN